MKKELINCFSVILTMIFVLSTQVLHAQKQTRQVDDFNSISLSISADVVLTQGSKSVAIEGNADDLEKVITEVDGNILRIKKEKKSRIKGKVTVYVSTPDLKTLSLAGSGNIIAKNKLLVSDLKCSVAGSGNIELFNLTAQNVEVSIAGSGDVGLKGKCNNQLSVHVAGSGDTDMKHFEANEVTVSIAGSGDVSVFAKSKLTVSITGSGDVYYKGKPSLMTSIMGSGSINTID